jgi:adenylate cyclase
VPERSRHQAHRWTRKAVRRVLTALASLAGACFIGTLGWTLTKASFSDGRERDARELSRLGRILDSTGQALARLSYDLPFVSRPMERPPEISVIYLDEQSARTLGQPNGEINRHFHAQLIRRLTREHARAVFFDIVFPGPAQDPDADRDLAAAMEENGHVFIGGALEIEEGEGAYQERTVPPVAVLRKAAAAWGLLVLRPVDPDNGVRQIYTGTDLVPSSTWRTAIKLGAPAIKDSDRAAGIRWLNYYGPSGCFPSYSIGRALSSDLPEGTFRDKIVCVGPRGTLSSLSALKDEFYSPFTRVGYPFTPGLEVHATILLNLLRGDWLSRLAGARELWLSTAVGLLLGAALPLFRPLLSLAAASFAIVVVLTLQFYLLQAHRVWFAWGVPVLVEVPFALGWAVIVRYFIEERRRSALRKAFAHYLSPEMADQISDSDFDLRPGGKLVEATIVFTDLQGFTLLSEQLDNPQLLAEVLNAYFTTITEHVFQNRGTIIKYIGDAVLAAWGPPLASKDHALEAVLAAWQMHQASGQEIMGHQLITRVGINTGQVLAGNLGSDFRFDYTVIGDAVNFASRIESLNKQLGTQVLLAEATHARLDGRFLTRRLGSFRVAGKTKAAGIFELLGPASAPSPAWLDAFTRALTAYESGDFAASRKCLLETITLRGGEDGPARFYLQQLDLLGDAPPAEWSGVIELHSK